jgi:hypothetical protein
VVSRCCPSTTSESGAVSNDCRLQNNLPAIPLSPALSLVANRHVRDLAMNIGRLTHDWSNCAMTDSNCMWKAPQRLGTSYPGNGFENAYGGPKGSPASPAAILDSWKEGGFFLGEKHRS